MTYRCRRISMSRRTASAGFTLIEMMVVMVIIGLLMALVGPRFIRQEEKAKVGAARAQIELLGTALDTFRLDVGRYPSTQEGLAALRQRPFGTDRWDGPYLKKDLPKDPWEHPYYYRSPGEGGRPGAPSDRAVIEPIRGAFEPAPGVAQILFYPNGATTGADVSLISRRDWLEKGRPNRILIHLDPWVGTVTVQ